MNIEEFNKIKHQMIEDLAKAMVKTMDEMNVSPREIEWFNPLLYTTVN